MKQLVSNGERAQRRFDLRNAELREWHADDADRTQPLGDRKCCGGCKRQQRRRNASRGNFIEVYCSTPVDVCETRDVKGMYAKARAAVASGKPMGFTGVDDPYEPPVKPEVSLDTTDLSVQQCVDRIINKLLELGYILPHGHIVE